MPIAWGTRPPPRLPHSYIRLLVVKAASAVLVARLGPVVGVSTHWTGEKTVACAGEDSCPYHDLVQTWKGYAPGVSQSGKDGNGRPSWKRCVLVVTPEIADAVDALPVGQPFIIARTGANKRSPLELQSSSLKRIDPIPDTFGVIPYVCRAMSIPLEFAGKLRLAQ